MSVLKTVMLDKRSKFFTPNNEKTKGKVRCRLDIYNNFSAPNRLRTKRPVVKKISSVSNLSCSNWRADASSKLRHLKCKRSLSLQEITPALKKDIAFKKDALCSSRAVQIMKEDVFETDRQRYLAYKGFAGFLKNSLAKKKEKNETQNIYMSSLSEQMRSMKMQIGVLKSLLTSDEQVITNFARELHLLKGQVALSQKKIKGLENEKETVEGNLEKLRGEINQLQTELMNEKNSFMLAKSEATALEAQLQKEREKIGKLKQEKKQLVDKVETINNLLLQKTTKLEDNSQKIGELEEVIICQVNALENAQQKIIESERCLDSTRESISTVKKDLFESVTREGKLTSELAEAKMKMEEQGRHFELLRHQQAPNFNLSHGFEWKNGFRYYKKRCGIGNEPLDTDSMVHASSPDSVRYDPSMTYGRTKPWVPPVFKPLFILFDKKCLTFNAFFRQSVTESPLEHYRTRIVKIIYFLEDDTVTVMEPTVNNAGFKQGRLVRRHKIVKDNIGSTWHWKDLNVGIDFPIYGIVYHICSCDKYTKEFLESQGVELNPDEEMPVDPYIRKRESGERVATRRTPQVGNDQLMKFHTYDRKVLRFFSLWDDRGSENGSLRYIKIHFYLIDDTIELVEIVKDPTQCIRLITRKMKIPKHETLPADYPACYLERTDAEVIQFVSPVDFVVGKTIVLFGRRLLIYDCDKFTRDYYWDCFEIQQPPKVDIPEAKRKTTIDLPLPRYTGYGSQEDSIQSLSNLQPKEPKKDFLRYLINIGKKLRYTAVMDSVLSTDADREFIIEYRISDGHALIHEIQKKNSGFMGGRFLSYMLIPKPNTNPDCPEFFTPSDFKLGATIVVFGHRFRITGVDLAVYRYMEANPDKFPADMVQAVRKHLTREGQLTVDIKDIAEFRRRDIMEKPYVDEDPEEKPPQDPPQE